MVTFPDTKVLFFFFDFKIDFSWVNNYLLVRLSRKNPISHLIEELMLSQIPYFFVAFFKKFAHKIGNFHQFLTVTFVRVVLSQFDWNHSASCFLDNVPEILPEVQSRPVTDASGQFDGSISHEVIFVETFQWGTVNGFNFVFSRYVMLNFWIWRKARAGFNCFFFHVFR